MQPAEDQLAAEIAAWLERAAAQDAAEDSQHGADRRGDEPPEWTRDKARRLATIRAARPAPGREQGAELEAEAKAAAAASQPRPRQPRPSAFAAGASQSIRRTAPDPRRSATSPTPTVGS